MTVEFEQVGSTPHQLARALLTSGACGVPVPGGGRVEFTYRDERVTFYTVGLTTEQLTASLIQQIESLRTGTEMYIRRGVTRFGAGKDIISTRRK